MTTRHDRPDRPEIDAVCLLDTGAALIEAIDPDGARSYWIRVDGPDDGLVRTPIHEDIGALPSHVQRRLDRMPSPGQCNAPTSLGRPCRNPAGHCRHHGGDA